jgi:hypothetical protein
MRNLTAKNDVLKWNDLRQIDAMEHTEEEPVKKKRKSPQKKDKCMDSKSNRCAELEGKNALIH